MANLLLRINVIVLDNAKIQSQRRLDVDVYHSTLPKSMIRSVLEAKWICKLFASGNTWVTSSEIEAFSSVMSLTSDLM